MRRIWATAKARRLFVSRRVVVHEGGQAIVGNVQPAVKVGEG